MRLREECQQLRAILITTQDALYTNAEITVGLGAMQSGSVAMRNAETQEQRTIAHTLTARGIHIIQQHLDAFGGTGDATPTVRFRRAAELRLARLEQEENEAPARPEAEDGEGEARVEERRA